ncbi:hypothetical protein BCR35DRAFT_353517 [Leucosporidium creatinivorum]|uniref:Mtf2-like C-terminal domain-containing protein n=1 Tax=Leucosporidium creatinivorum TaxID=106004 RepID=A0A1Y2EXP6_9BASI|nr:hypothetical protein BCR35DRAFT_353517 [Leucosporidium creatinivorum]
MMLRAGRLTALKGCTCTLPLRLASYSTGSSSKNSDESSAPESSTSTKPAATESPLAYTRPQDAYDPLFADLPPAPRSSWASSSSFGSPSPASVLHSARPAPLQPFTHPTTSRSSARAPLQHSQPRQRQKLSPTEAQTFAELLHQILPTQPARSGHEGGLFGRTGQANALAAEKVEQALQRTLAKKGARPRRVKIELSDREVEQLDKMRETMVGFESDLELYRWALVEVFGFPSSETIFPDLTDSTNLAGPPPAPADSSSTDPSTLPLPKGPSSPIYPDLLLILFLLLRDTYRAPHLALHVFTLASSTPYSYVLGCHTALYNEVLRTKWMEGDVESVAAGVEEMRSAGVRMDERTREIVDAIGRAIRVDEERAEARVVVTKAEIKSSLLSTTNDPSADSESVPRPAGLSHKEEELLLKRSRFFGSHQVGAWSKMERVVEENQEETLARQERMLDDRWREIEARREREEDEERNQAERERPNLFFGADSGRRRRRDPYAFDQDRHQPDSFSSFSRRAPAPYSTDSTYDDPSRPLPSTFFPRRRDEVDSPSSPTRSEDGTLLLPKRPSFANPFKIRQKARSREEKARRDKPHPMMAWKQT